MERSANDDAVAEMHWGLMTEIEALEELIADARQLGEDDDALALHANSLSQALRQRRRALRAGLSAVDQADVARQRGS
jgi:hypothetical protein